MINQSWFGYYNHRWWWPSDRTELKLNIVLLGTDFLLAYNVGLQYDSATASLLVHINGERVSLLSDQMESNLGHYYPSTFLTDSTTTQELQQSNFASPANPLLLKGFGPKQQDFDEFFHLEKEPIDNMSINSFWKECKAVK